MSISSDATALSLQAPVADHLAVIHVSGDDAAEFLQAQFCNDLSAVDADRAQLSGYCNPKGRLIATFYIAQFGAAGNEFLLVVAADVAEAMCKRLQMFVLRAAVKLDLSLPQHQADATSAKSNKWRCVASLSPTTPAQLQDGTTNPFRVTSKADHVEISLPAEDANIARVLHLLRASADIPVDAAVDSQDGHTETICADWYLQDIRAGIPWITRPISESLVPQMVNMQLINGLSFKKGCYPGQEIVARMQYLGKLKRRMYRVKVAPQGGQSASDLMQPGDAVQLDQKTDVGELIQIAPLVSDSAPADDAYEALVVLRVDAVPAAHSWQSTDGKIGDQAVVLTALPLPYAFEAEDDVTS